MAMEIFFASDEGYAKHLLVAISSILLNADKDDEFNIYILDGGIKKENRDKILSLKKFKNFNLEFISPDASLTDGFLIPKEIKHLTKQTYYRYLIPVLKPNLKKALYLDCDLAVNGSLKELYNTDLKDKYCAAVKETNQICCAKGIQDTGVKNYFNAGVLLINSEKWVKENIFETLIKNTERLYKENKLSFFDQDVLNYTFRENVIFIDHKFNFTSNGCLDISDINAKPVIVHFCGGTKPWKQGYDFFADSYLKPLYLAGYKNEYYKIKLYHLFIKFLHRIFLVKNKYKNYKKYKLIQILGFRFLIKTK